MAVKIRLSRRGAKKKPFYRIVVADSRYPTDGRIIDTVGVYDPNQKPARVEVKSDKLQTWISRGAKPTDTVRTLLKRARSADSTAPETAA